MHPIDRTHGRGLAAYRLPLDSGVYPPKRDPAGDITGNELDDCGVCVLLPTVSGKGVRATQVGCPVHGEPRSDLPEGQQSKGLVALVAEVMHRELDAVDENWHLSCMDPDGDGSCAKGHYARRMLAEDVAPKVIEAVVARVRAAALEEVAQNLDAHAAALAPEGDRGDSASSAVFADALRWAARRARCPRCPAGICSEHHAAPAERSVGSPTPEVGTSCCDMHNRNCEPPSELCCRNCTEAAHDTFPLRHADGSRCVLDQPAVPSRPETQEGN